MTNIPEIFGSMVFNDEVMRAKLPNDIYISLHKTIEERRDLDITVASVVANAMKDWAIEKGATHYTHWFQPLNDVTAEKHDSFISPQKDGGIIMEFSGKELIKGESDASSFPSGGLRATFEARGYTAWDPTSYAFIKNNSLCIPTVFCSYGGEVLDKKTPLLRSMDAVSAQAERTMRLFGYRDFGRVVATAGPEQEYFLIDRDLWLKRRDLMYTGRTLFGAKAPKGQEMDDHYYGTIKPRVMEFMQELNLELWKLGVYAKTEHNEAAPSQHELAPVFTVTNTAADQNQIIMEFMRRIADRHNLACLLHEKPFASVSGSGKHNNWSLNTTSGMNLFKPGSDVGSNKLFQLMLCAVMRAVDEHQDLLRISVAGAGNDHRLGGHEAPPAVISMFIGSDLSNLLDCIENGTVYDKVSRRDMSVGVNALPQFKQDTTDRNRTSPLAFTGNKFEFRMPGSSHSIADCNIVLNTITADVLCDFADRLEQAEDFNAELDGLLRETVRNHRRIVFNGDNYSREWAEEAERRGLLNLRTTADALPYLASEKNIALYERHNVFRRSELVARREIILSNYAKILNIEARTMLYMARREIIPACAAFETSLLGSLSARAANDLPGGRLSKLAKDYSALLEELIGRTDELESLHARIFAFPDAGERADYCRDEIIPAMEALRETADTLETLTPSTSWPFPTYGDLLFSVN
ncbi:MAG: glutamine synthetase type III [Clostridiales bacterium]|nr:glutamine synthetase type III [Clostridiales bacterium]